MTTATTVELQEHLDRYLRNIAKSPVVVTRQGKPVALLMPPDEDTLYELKLLNSPRFLAILAEGQRQIEAGEYMTHEEFWKKVKERNALRERQKAKQKGARKKAVARS